jgi:hypothetical protein
MFDGLNDKSPTLDIHGTSRQVNTGNERKNRALQQRKAAHQHQFGEHRPSRYVPCNFTDDIGFGLYVLLMSGILKQRPAGEFCVARLYFILLKEIQTLKSGSLWSGATNGPRRV